MHDPFFQAELKRQRTQLFGAASDRLRNLVPKALDVIERELEGPNGYKAAFEILRLAGIDRTGRTGPSARVTDIGPTDAKAMIKAEVRQVRISDADAMFKGLTGKNRGIKDERTEALSRFEMRRKALGGE